MIMAQKTFPSSFEINTILVNADKYETLQDLAWQLIAQNLVQYMFIF